MFKEPQLISVFTLTMRELAEGWDLVIEYLKLVLPDVKQEFLKDDMGIILDSMSQLVSDYQAKGENAEISSEIANIAFALERLMPEAKRYAEDPASVEDYFLDADIDGFPADGLPMKLYETLESFQTFVTQQRPMKAVQEELNSISGPTAKVDLDSELFMSMIVPKLDQKSLSDVEMSYYLLSIMAALGGAENAEKAFEPYFGTVEANVSGPLSYLLTGTGRDEFYASFGTFGSLFNLREVAGKLLLVQEVRMETINAPGMRQMLRKKSSAMVATLLVLGDLARNIRKETEGFEDYVVASVWQQVLEFLWPVMDLLGFSKDPFNFSQADLFRKDVYEYFGSSQVPDTVPVPETSSPTVVIPSLTPIPVIIGEGFAELVSGIIEYFAQLFGLKSAGLVLAEEDAGPSSGAQLLIEDATGDKTGNAITEAATAAFSSAVSAGGEAYSVIANQVTAGVNLLSGDTANVNTETGEIVSSSSDVDWLRILDWSKLINYGEKTTFEGGETISASIFTFVFIGLLVTLLLFVSLYWTFRFSGKMTRTRTSNLRIFNTKCVRSLQKNTRLIAETGKTGIVASTYVAGRVVQMASLFLSPLSAGLGTYSLVAKVVGAGLLTATAYGIVQGLDFSSFFNPIIVGLPATAAAFQLVNVQNVGRSLRYTLFALTNVFLVGFQAATLFNIRDQFVTDFSNFQDKGRQKFRPANPSPFFNQENFERVNSIQVFQAVVFTGFAIRNLYAEYRDRVENNQRRMI